MTIEIIDRVGNVCRCGGESFDIFGLEIHGIPLKFDDKNLDWVRWWTWFMNFRLTVDGIEFDKNEYQKERDEQAKSSKSSQEKSEGL